MKPIATMILVAMVLVFAVKVQHGDFGRAMQKGWCAWWHFADCM